MTEVTDADRTRAQEVRRAMGQVAGWPRQDEVLAAALAEERAKARAPFREIVERHAWGEEDPLAVRDELLRALRGTE